MTIRLQTDLLPGYARATYAGPYVRDEGLRAWESAFAFASAENQPLLLIDTLGLSGQPPTTMDRHDHGMKLAALQKEYDCVHAVAIVGKEPMIEPDRFLALIANSSGANVQVFETVQAALDWLESEGSRLEKHADSGSRP